MHRLGILSLLMLGALIHVAGCSGRGRASEPAVSATTRAPSEGLILQESEGERRVRRPGMSGTLSAPFVLKVDPKNGGSPDLTMGYEDIPPGQGIPPHLHPLADEILFVHRGSGTASLGPRTAPVTAGTTIYIPRNTRISLQNTGTEPLSIAFIFSRPGFEDYLRETSVPEGQQAAPLSPEELARIRSRHPDHVVYEARGASH